jgi:hypothetical protein
MFTTVAAHAALQAIMQGITPEALLDPNTAAKGDGLLASAAQLCRFLCSRLENVRYDAIVLLFIRIMVMICFMLTNSLSTSSSYTYHHDCQIVYHVYCAIASYCCSWRVWYEKTYCRKKSSGRESPSNLMNLTDEPRGHDLASQQDNLGRHVARGLRRSKSEPNLLAMRLTAKEQQYRVKQWLANSLTDALKSGSALAALIDSDTNTAVASILLSTQNRPRQQNQTDTLSPSSNDGLSDSSDWTSCPPSPSKSDSAVCSLSMFSKCHSALTTPKRSLLSQLLQMQPTSSIVSPGASNPSLSHPSSINNMMQLDAMAARRRSLRTKSQSAQKTPTEKRSSLLLSSCCPGPAASQTTDIAVITTSHGASGTHQQSEDTSTDPVSSPSLRDTVSQESMQSGGRSRTLMPLTVSVPRNRVHSMSSVNSFQSMRSLTSEAVTEEGGTGMAEESVRKKKSSRNLADFFDEDVAIW